MGGGGIGEGGNVVVPKGSKVTFVDLANAASDFVFVDFGGGTGAAERDSECDGHIADTKRGVRISDVASGVEKTKVEHGVEFGLAGFGGAAAEGNVLVEDDVIVDVAEPVPVIHAYV